MVSSPWVHMGGLHLPGEFEMRENLSGGQGEEWQREKDDRHMGEKQLSVLGRWQEV